jgi:hypothetical protein
VYGMPDLRSTIAKIRLPSQQTTLLDLPRTTHRA